MDADRPEPTYKTTKEEGPAHDRYFEVVCTVNANLSTTGAGKTKKQAKKEAGGVLSWFCPTLVFVSLCDVFLVII